MAATNTLAAIAAAVYFVADWLPREVPQEPLVSKALLAVLATAVLVLNLLRVLYFRSGRRKDIEGPLLSHTSDGVVHVSREAVEVGLRTAGEALDEVTRLRVHVVTPTRKKTLVRAHYMAPDGVQILDLSSRLRRLLMERFHQLVRLERDAKLEVEMVFEGFHGRARSKPQEPEQEPAKTEETAETPPFTGPRYPIDVEGESL